MSEKMRGALFNALGDIQGLSFFDAYAGSGAIGLEAISRGAKYVLFTDKERQAVTTIKKNIKTLNINKSMHDLSEANCVSYVQNKPQEFDVIVADPPYDDVKLTQIEQLAQALRPTGLLILSLPTLQENKITRIVLARLEQQGFKTEKTKNYGDASLIFLSLN